MVAGPWVATSAFADPTWRDRGGETDTATPIRHLVVIFQENVSFDHYFATYPYAANTDGTTFRPSDDTPSVDGLGTLVSGEPSGVLLTNNPNATNPANSTNAVDPSGSAIPRRRPVTRITTTAPNSSPSTAA